MDPPIRRSADVLSHTVLLDGARYAIVGVMPPGFAFRAERSISGATPVVARDEG